LSVSEVRELNVVAKPGLLDSASDPIGIF
jgi:hypothetical protein